MCSVFCFVSALRVLAGVLPPVSRTHRLTTLAVKKKVLLNMGMIKARLMDGQEEVIAISFITQISEDPDSKALIRTVFNPLE